MARFAPIAPNPYLGQRNAPRTSSSVLRYYQERQPLLKNMDEVIGTTTAPSSQHQFAGTTPDGYAIWKKAEPAPAPAPSGGGGGGGGGGPDYASQIQALNEQAAAYRKQAEDIIAQGEAKVKELQDADLQRQKAAELQNRLSIQAQASQARGQMGPSLKIAGAGQTPMTAGTQAFKRRRDQMTLAPIQSTAGINVPSGSVLNV